MTSADRAGAVVVVTGAAGGIGTALVERFTANGSRVVAADLRPDAVKGEPAARERIDVTDASSVDGLAERVRARFGALDVWINVAGYLERGLALDMTVENWTRSLDVNLSGTFHGCRAAARVMRESGGGSIVNIASYSGLRPRTGCAGYAAAKSGVAHLTACLALEWGEFGIRVNAVAPGYVETPMIAWMADEDARGRLVARTPLARFAEPQEIAEAVLYMSGPGATYVTGTTLTVDGGISLS